MDFYNLIQKAKAQGADTLATPTFPYTPPGEPNTPVDQDQVLIKLNTDDTTLDVGEVTTIRIYVETADNKASSFNISVAYDPDYLKVNDASATTAGTQINYIDDTFEQTENIVNTTSGIITIKGSADEASTITRTIAEIEVTALKAGSTEIEVIQNNSNIISTQGVDLLENSNSINFSISSQTGQNVISPNETTIIPSTALTDHSSIIFTGLAGAILISSGIYLIKSTREKNNPK